MGPGSDGRYICSNWVQIRPLFLRPLEEGRTYAALILKGLQDVEGKPFQADEDLLKMLEPISPQSTNGRYCMAKIQASARL